MTIHFIQISFKSYAQQITLKFDNKWNKSIYVKPFSQACISKEVKVATTIR